MNEISISCIRFIFMQAEADVEEKTLYEEEWRNQHLSQDEDCQNGQIDGIVEKVGTENM
jgi:hypothetical protein